MLDEDGARDLPSSMYLCLEDTYEYIHTISIYMITIRILTFNMKTLIGYKSRPLNNLLLYGFGFPRPRRCG